MEYAYFMRKLFFILVLLFLTVGALFAQENVNDYFPVVVGSKWLYANGSGKLSDIITVTNTTIDQKDGTGLYLIEHQIEGIGTTSTMYSTKGNKIVILVFKNALGRYTEYRQPYPVELAPAGQEWSYNDRGDNLRLKTTKASCSFDGKTYSDCILVEERIVSGNNVLRTKKSYYAKGIGLVYVTLQSAGERESVFMKLLEYSRLGNAQTNIKNDTFIFQSLLDVDYAHTAVAKVLSGKIQFFIRPSTTGAKWVLSPEIDFILPKDFDYIFSDEDYLCVVINNIVHPYKLIDNQWKEISEYIFTIPINYDHLFINGYLCIVTDKKIKFFELDDNNQFNENIEMIFDLPNGYKGVFSTGVNKISIIINNIVKFYEYNEANKIWIENTDWAFSLPTGSINVINVSFAIIGVVFDTHIQFYVRTPNKWELMRFLQFP